MRSKNVNMSISWWTPIPIVILQQAKMRYLSGCFEHHVRKDELQDIDEQYELHLQGNKYSNRHTATQPQVSEKDME